MKKMNKILFVSLLTLGLHAVALSPPWYLFQNQVKATMQKDPCVHVDDLQESTPQLYYLNLHVCRQNKATALAAFMDRDHVIGAITVRIRVFYGSHQISGADIPNNLSQAQQIVSRALAGNRYFQGFASGNMTNDFFIRFSKSVIQYDGDNLADAYGNINEVAADAFASVLGLDQVTSIRIGTTTAASSPDQTGN